MRRQRIGMKQVKTLEKPRIRNLWVASVMLG